MAMPFVPGIELGLALMVLLPSKGVVLVYFCTLLSLSLSFCDWQVDTAKDLRPVSGVAASA
jgi:hypothetical protein